MSRTIGDWLVEVLDDLGGEGRTGDIYEGYGELTDTEMTSGKKAGIRSVLQKDDRFYRVKRGVYGLKGEKPAEDEEEEEEPVKEEPEDKPEEKPAVDEEDEEKPVVEEPVATGDLRSRPSVIYLPEAVFDEAPLSVLEKMWENYLEGSGDWQYLSDGHRERLKRAIEERSGGDELHEAPSVSDDIVIEEPEHTREVIDSMPEPDLPEYTSEDDELLRQYSAPDGLPPADLPTPRISTGGSLGPTEVGRTYTTDPEEIPEVVDEVELRRRLERQRVVEEGEEDEIYGASGTFTRPSRRRRLAPGWLNTGGSDEPDGSRGYRSRYIAPGWLNTGGSDEPDGSRGYRSRYIAPGWFSSPAIVEEPYVRELEQENRLLRVEDSIEEWKEKVESGEITEEAFADSTAGLYEELEYLDPDHPFVLERDMMADTGDDGKLLAGSVIALGATALGYLWWKSRGGWR